MVLPQHVAGDRLALQVVEVAGGGDPVVGHDAVDVVQGQEDVLGGGDARVVPGAGAAQGGGDLGVQALEVLAVGGGLHLQHSEPRVPQGVADAVGAGIGQHQVGGGVDHRLGVIPGDFGQVLETLLGAVLAAQGQLGLAAQGQHHVRQAGGEHRHLLGPGGDGHLVYLHGELPGGGHAGDDLAYVGTACQRAAGQNHTKHQRAQAPETAMQLHSFSLAFFQLPRGGRVGAPLGVAYGKQPPSFWRPPLLYPLSTRCVNRSNEILDFSSRPGYNKKAARDRRSARRGKFGDVPKWLKGPHSKFSRNLGSRASKNGSRPRVCGLSVLRQPWF